MEWTIARDRWQLHLKSKGAWYAGWAARLGGSAETGAPAAALALRSLGALFERCRLDRLTRNQHILFRLGELAAWAETAAIFSERAAAQPSTVLSLSPAVLGAMARVHAREALLRVSTEGMKWANAAGQTDGALASRLGIESRPAGLPV